MKTDGAIYQFLRTGPEAFRVLTGGLELVGNYRFRSLTVKGLERRLDGIFEPEGHDGPAYVVEFQGQLALGTWYNLLTKMGLCGEEYPQRNVIGIGVFLHRGLIPANPLGIHRDDGPIRAVALDEFLPQWLETYPDNPYVTVFAPLLLESDAELRERAAQLWQTVQQAPLDEDIRGGLSEVLEFWFFDRFRNLTAKEIWAMLKVLTPIEETKAYQSIYAEGESAGEKKGEKKGEEKGQVKANARTLQRQLKRRFGTVSSWAEERIAAAGDAQLQVWLDGIFDATSVEDLLK